MNAGTKILDKILTVKSNNIKKVYHDQQRFIPGMQGCSHIWKWK